MGAQEINVASIAARIKEERFDEVHLLDMVLGGDAVITHAEPFGGKDTVSEIMALVFGGVYASSGELLRRATLDAAGKESLDRGDVVDSDIFFTHALPLIAGPEHKDKMLWLSAVGRCTGEPKRVVGFLAERDHNVAAVIYIEVDHDELRRRRAAGRSGDPRPDDGAEQFEHRLKEFMLKTLPAIQEYEALVPMVRIDGFKHPHDVALSVIDGLYEALIG